MGNIEEEFKQVSSKGSYIAIDLAHPQQIYIGLNINENKSILLIHTANIIQLTGNNFIEVSQFDIEGKNALQFSLIDSSLENTFYEFCEDIIEKTKSIYESSDAYCSIYTLFNINYKDKFNLVNNYLSQKDIINTIGKLHYLDSVLIPKYKEEKAINGWITDGINNHGFSYDNITYNVETRLTTDKDFINKEDKSGNTRNVKITLKENKTNKYTTLALNRLYIDLCFSMPTQDLEHKVANKFKQLDINVEDYLNFCYDLISIEE